MKKKDFKSALPMWAMLTIPVLWLAIVAAYAYEGGKTVFDWMDRFSQALGTPFAIRWTPHTPKFLLGGWHCTALPLPFTTPIRSTAVQARNTAPPRGAMRGHWTGSTETGSTRTGT